MKSHLSEMWKGLNKNQAFTSIASRYTNRTVVMIRKDSSSQFMDEHSIVILFDPTTDLVTEVLGG